MVKLDIKNLSIQINKDGKFIDKILNQNFTISEGDVVLITGPNGSGKSAIIKSLVGDTLDFKALHSSGSFLYYDNNSVVNINESDESISYFASKVCYISQSDETAYEEILDCFLSSIAKESIENKIKYVFDFVLNNKIYESYFNDDSEVIMNRKAEKLLELLNIDEKDDAHIKTALYLKSKKKNMSGGQAKFLNIASNLIKYKFCDLCLIDEPLNNLDYSNVRLFSNILASIHNEKPKLAFIIVTHCRAIPIINKVIEIDSKTKALKQYPNDEVKDIKSILPSECNSCFGKIVDSKYI